MPRAKTHNAKKISPYSLHVCVACGYKCAPLCTMYMSSAGVAIVRATAYHLYFC